jgi:hypothetical protein
VSAESKKIELDRRASQRFPMAWHVRYRVVGGGAARVLGTGKTVNISSSGILFRADQVLAQGVSLELDLDWPAKLDGKISMKLSVRGRIVRSDEGDHALVGLKVDRHEFRTASARADRDWTQPQVGRSRS